MNGNLFINGYDAYETWGVVLDENGYANLLGGETMKPYTTNESRAVDGVQVLIKNPRVSARNITLTFCFVNSSVSLVTRLKAFFSELKKGLVLLKVPDLNATYRLIYEANTSFMQSNLKIAKVTIKFQEANPKNRAID